jgi:hypothetical protein
MNTFLTSIFNNGDNDGDITIMSKNGDKIGCHSYVMKVVSGYFKSESHFVSHKKLKTSKKDNHRETVQKTFNLDYDTKIICSTINLLYSSTYKIDTNMTMDNLFEIMTLLDYLSVDNISIEETIDTSMTNKFTYDDWDEIVNKINNYPISIKYVHRSIGKYFYDNIISDRERLDKDPLANLNMDSPLIKFLGDQYRKYIIQNRRSWHR